MPGNATSLSAAMILAVFFAFCQPQAVLAQDDAKRQQALDALDQALGKPSGGGNPAPPSTAGDGQTAKDYITRGEAAKKADNYDQAIVEFTKAIEMEPNRYEGYYLRAGSWYAKGDRDKAVDDLNASLKVQPNSSAYYLLAGIRWKEGGGDQAVVYLSKAIEIDPSNVDCYFLRGVIFGSNGNFERAIKDFDLVIKRRPDFAFAYIVRASAWMEKGNKAKARADAAKAKQLDPSIELPSF